MKKSIILSFFIVIISFIYSNKILVSAMPEGIKLSIFDLIILPTGGGIASTMSLSFPVMPIFCFLLINILNFGNNNHVIIKEKSRKEIWNKQCKLILIVSFIYSVVIIAVGYISSGLILSDFANKWNSNESYIYNLLGNTEKWDQITGVIDTPKLLLLIFIGVFLGLSAIGFFIGLLKINLNNKYIYLILIVLIFSDAINSFSFILKQMTLTYNNWIDPKSIILNFMYLILVIVVCYMIGKNIIINKDFLCDKG